MPINAQFRLLFLCLPMDKALRGQHFGVLLLGKGLLQGFDMDVSAPQSPLGMHALRYIVPQTSDRSIG